QRLHVGERVDGNAAVPHFAPARRSVGVLAHQGRHVEGDGETRLPIGEQVLVAAVGLLGGREPRELAHGPEPAAVPARMNAARVRELARKLLGAVGKVVGGVERLERDARDRRGLEAVVPLRTRLELLAPHLFRVAGSNFQLNSLSDRRSRISSAVRYGVPSLSSRSRSDRSSSSARRVRSRASSAATSAVSSRRRLAASSPARPLDSRCLRWARTASQSCSTPSPLVATVGMIGGRQGVLGARLSIVRSSATTRPWPSISALLTTKTSAISRMPALIICTLSPRLGVSTTTVV